MELRKIFGTFQSSLAVSVLGLMALLTSSFSCVAFGIIVPHPQGVLQVIIKPDEAAAAGALWRAEEDPEWHRSGEYVSLDFGSHYIYYSSPVPGWQAPGYGYATVSAGEPTTVVASFTRITGALSVNLRPSLAVQCGAKWRIDNGEWLDAGTTMSGVTAGSHVVSFRDMAGWLTPTSRLVSVVGYKTNGIAASYVGGKVSPVTINGNGTISPNLVGRLMQVGKEFTVTATPASGWFFTGWTGSHSSSKRTITFTVLPETAVQANFVRSPFTALKGSYSGLFYETNAAKHETSGYLKLEVSAMGAYSGTVLRDGKRNSISGKFNILGCATNVIASRSGPSTEILMSLDLSDDSGVLSGLVTRGEWYSALHAERSAQNHPVPNVGSYTMLLGQHEAEGIVDKGMGYATVKLTGGGAVQFKWRLADGTKSEGTGSVSRDGRCAVYLPLYKSAGSLFGWLQFTNPTEQYDLTGELLWTRPSNSAASVFREGFCDWLVCRGCRYVVPAKGSPVIVETNSIITFTGGNLDTEFCSAIMLKANNRVTCLDTNMLVMGVVPSSGVVTGKVAVPFSGEVLRFDGAVLQKHSTGGGFFLQSGRSGSVLISPQISELR